MKVAVFSAKAYDRTFLEAANRTAGGGHDLRFIEARLKADTAALAGDARAVCAFVNDTLDRPALTALANGGVGLIALRSAGFNHVDLPAAKELGVAVARVPPMRSGRNISPPLAADM